jgi:hypothetical protein
MTKEIIIAWFTGLFEGEGSFGFSNGRAKRLSMVSTDKDVLMKVKELLGGNLYSASRRGSKEHWKEAYVWTITGSPAIELCHAMEPYLMSRRKARMKEWLDDYRSRRNKILLHKKELVTRVLELRSSGMTHKQIAETVGYERSHITKILNKRDSL